MERKKKNINKKDTKTTKISSRQARKRSPARKKEIWRLHQKLKKLLVIQPVWINVRKIQGTCDNLMTMRYYVALIPQRRGRNIYYPRMNPSAINHFKVRSKVNKTGKIF